MTVTIPSDILECRSSLELIGKAISELSKPREVLQEKLENGVAGVSEIQDISTQYSRLLLPAREIYKTIKLYIDDLKEQLEDNFKKAEAAGKGDNFKHGSWYTERQEMLEQFGDDANIALNLKAELERYVHDCKSKIQRSDTLKKESSGAHKQPHQPKAEASSTRNRQQFSALPDQKATGGTHMSLQDENFQQLNNDLEEMVSERNQLKDKVQFLHYENEHLKERLEQLSSEKKKYKKKYRVQKKLSKKNKVDRNRQERVKNGLASVTFEVLRTRRR